MQQILQNLNTGETVVESVPCPQLGAGSVLVQTACSLVSVGTEKMLVNFGKANLVEKVRQQPDKVRMVLDKVRTDGLMPTLEAVRAKLDQPLAMGYCNVGRALAVGSAVAGIAAGDRLVSNGSHAEVIAVSRNLCARVPDNVGDEEAVFTVVGAIGLQGVRLAQPTLGEAFVVTGLGLIGLLTVQLLQAHGCRVLGIDFDAQKLRLAASFGAEVVDLSKGEDPLAAAQRFSRGRGVDGVLLTASTDSNDPVHQAAQMCRKRGRIVLVGVVGLSLSRADFYEKELSFQVSCSYGPGRYDADYEQKGNDYPLGFVRWTEQRNFEAVLDMLSLGKLDVKPLITHRFALAQAAEAYAVLADQSPLGVVLQYPRDRTGELLRTTVDSGRPPAPAAATAVSVGFVGAGNYAARVLIPAFAASGAALAAVASKTGVSAVHMAKKFAIPQSTTDTSSLIARDDIQCVVITTRHDSHAPLVIEALRAGKDVFVEKPLALTPAQLEEIIDAYRQSQRRLLVGFNRRFAPQAIKMRQLLAAAPAPKVFVMVVNAGEIAAGHWTQDRQVGGGRIIGEACHFVDLLRFLAGSAIVKVAALKSADRHNPLDCADTVSIALGFEDGSSGTIHYLANGPKSLAKERLEVFCNGAVLQLDNFRKLKGYNWPGFSKMNLIRQDKGNKACVAAFVAALQQGGAAPIAFEEIVEVTRTCFDIVGQITS